MSQKSSFSVSNNTEAIPNDKRLTYYLNNLSEQKVSLDLDEVVVKQPSLNRKKSHLITFADFDRSFIFWYCKHIVHLWGIRKIRVLPWFKTYKTLHSLRDILPTLKSLGMAYKDSGFLFYYGEHGTTPACPVIKKARRLDDKDSVLFKLGTMRHFAPCSKIDKHDLIWSEKKNAVVWRGATTGKNQRVDFVKKYYHNFDIAFSSVKQKPDLSSFQKNKMSIKAQLTYKFIVSLEGNELASNLKWILFSNSVPIMPSPTWCSWVMEDKLVPYKHYLPLNDGLDNLEELMKWAYEHDDECKQIALNGRKYISQFFDEKNELLIKEELLKEYTCRVTFNE